MINAGVAPNAPIQATAEKAYKEFAKAASDYIDSGGSIEDISASVAGFSRGGATAVKFAQLVNERGLVDAEGNVLAPPGSIPITGMALLDPVGRFVDGDLSIPPNVQGQVLVVQAANENRADFRPLDFSGDERVTTVQQSGNHVGIGGGYDQGGTAANVLEGVTGYFQNRGVAVADVPVEQRFNSAVEPTLYTDAYRTDSQGNVLTNENGTKLLAWSVDDPTHGRQLDSVEHTGALTEDQQAANAASLLSNLASVGHYFLMACALSTTTLVSMAQDGYTGKPPVPVAGELALPQAEIKTRYQNCELGYYHGARPGKMRYVKDRYIWAVTPEFAKKFCMPQEFVSQELKGAEAVAFKLVPGGFGENCGFGGKAEVCSQGVDLRFEIYISRDVKLPVKNEVDFTAPGPKNSSLSLVGGSELSLRLNRERWQKNPEPGMIPRFEGNAFGLAGIQGDKVVWPLTTLYLDEYRGKLYDGSIDYIAVQGQTGNFRNERRLKMGIQDFVIQMDQPKDKRMIEKIPVHEFAHVIYLPRAFSAQVQALDLGEGTDWEALAKSALMPTGTDK